MEAGNAAWGAWALPEHPAAPSPPPPPVVNRPARARANPDDARNRRVLAVLVDIVLLCLGYVAAILVGPDGVDWEAVGTTAPSAVIVAVLSLGYFAVLEGIFGQTIGKVLCDVRIVDGDWRPAGTGRAVIRSILRPVDHVALGALGAIVVIATGSGKRQRVGDLAAGTYVVRASQLPFAPAAGGTILLVGAFLALLPAAWFAAPGTAGLVPRSPEYQVQQTSARYLDALDRGDAVTACAQMASGYRRALLAMDRGGGASDAGACAGHSPLVLEAAQRRIPAPGTRRLDQHVAISGPVAYFGPAGRPVLSLRREDGRWRVDPEAALGHAFVSGCTGTGAASSICDCMFDELRARGAADGRDFGAMMDRIVANGLNDPAVQASYAACGVSG